MPFSKDKTDLIKARLLNRLENGSLSKEPFHDNVITLNDVITPLFVNVPHAVEMQVVAVIDLADELSIPLHCAKYNITQKAMVIERGMRGLHNLKSVMAVKRPH